VTLDTEDPACPLRARIASQPNPFATVPAPKHERCHKRVLCRAYARGTSLMNGLPEMPIA